MQTNPEYQQYKKMTAGSDRHHLDPTPPDIEGPFYKAGASLLESCVIAMPKKYGDPFLRISGRVLNQQGEAIEDAILDIWQADSDGVYDNDGFNFRGKVTVCKEHIVGSLVESYRFDTIPPGDYKISDTEYRCAHIHVRVTAAGYKTLTTQLYFPDDTYNAADNWFDVRRVVNIPDGQFNFVLEKE